MLSEVLFLYLRILCKEETEQLKTSLLLTLYLLFSSRFFKNNVDEWISPRQFGYGMIIPFFLNFDGDRTTRSSFRKITLSPCY